MSLYILHLRFTWNISDVVSGHNFDEVKEFQGISSDAPTLGFRKMPRRASLERDSDLDLSVIPRPSPEADDALAAGQAQRFRRDRQEGMAVLVGFFLDNGLILHVTDQVPKAYAEWWEDACQEGYLLRNIWGIWRLSVVTEKGLVFWNRHKKGDSDNTVLKPRPERSCS